METQVSFPCPISYLLCCLLMLFLCVLLAVWLGISVEVDVDRITILLSPSSLPSYYILSLPTFLSLIQVTVMHQSIPAMPIPPGQPRGICSRCQSRGWGIGNFIAAPGGLGDPRAFDTRVKAMTSRKKNVRGQIM